MDKLWLHYIIIEIDDIQNRTGRVVQKEKKVPKYNQIYYMVQWRTFKYVQKY